MLGQVKSASGLIVLFSLWLIVSPWVLSFAGSTGMWDAVVVGVLALVLAWIRYANPLGTAGLSWAVVLLGIWLFASTFLFGWVGLMRVFWDYAIVGAAYVIFGLWSAVNRDVTTPMP